MQFIFSFIIYFFSFLFNNLYFNIFKVLRRYLFILPKSYGHYTIQKKVCYIAFVGFFIILNLFKIYLYIFIYLIFLYKILFRIFVNFKKKFKEKNAKFLDFIFSIYWFNLLIYLKVLNRKMNDVIKNDYLYYSLKWNCYYYYFYTIYMCKDSLILCNWAVLQLHSRFIFFLRIKMLQIIYYIKLFIKGFLGIYVYSYIVAFIRIFKISIHSDKFIKKAKRRGILFIIKLIYNKIKYIINAIFNGLIKIPFFSLKYFIINFIDLVALSLFKTGANYIIYYFYKFIKYSYSICVYFFDSDVIYRFLKFISRKKW